VALQSQGTIRRTRHRPPGPLRSAVDLGLWENVPQGGTGWHNPATCLGPPTHPRQPTVVVRARSRVLVGWAGLPQSFLREVPPPPARRWEVPPSRFARVRRTAYPQPIGN
jgi:hypothetical protein